MGLGEAAKLVTDETGKQYADVAWSDAARMRDRLVHQYFDIDREVLWSTIIEDLPGILKALPPEA